MNELYPITSFELLYSLCLAFTAGLVTGLWWKRK
jgi:hypothetical protein